MKKLYEFADAPVSSPVVADEVLEFHVARILLLLRHSGVKGRRIDSLTKLAKLDFFVRYPEFFSVAAEQMGHESVSRRSVESRMIRYRYGPWDERYYQVLGYLEAVGLLTATQEGSALKLALTDHGVEMANTLTEQEPFRDLVEHIKEVRDVLGRRSGTQLKKLVYELFEDEVSGLSLGEVIE